MHRREALKLIQSDMDKYNYKEVSYLADGRTYMNVTVKSVTGTFYRYIYDELSQRIYKYELVIDMRSQVYIGTIESEVKTK